MSSEWRRLCHAAGQHACGLLALCLPQPCAPGGRQAHTSGKAQTAATRGCPPGLAPRRSKLTEITYALANVYEDTDDVDTLVQAHHRSTAQEFMAAVEAGDTTLLRWGAASCIMGPGPSPHPLRLSHAPSRRRL